MPNATTSRLRPGLMMAAIEELQAAGVEPDIWKIEGIDDRESCRRIAELVRRDGRDSVSCVVLGRGASDEKVDAWLRAGSGLPGYIGFAIGRSIFGDAVKALAADGGDRRGRCGADRGQVPPLHRRLRGLVAVQKRTGFSGRRSLFPCIRGPECARSGYPELGIPRSPLGGIGALRRTG